jgi:cell division protein FtsW
MAPRQTVVRRRSTPTQTPDNEKMDLGRKHRPDYWLLIWCVILLAVGLTIIYAISPAVATIYHTSDNYYTFRQIMAIALGIVAFIVTYKVPLAWWRSAYKPLLIIAGLGTLVALALPVNPLYPAHRWIRLGPFSVQSVEILKFAGMIWLSNFLAKRIKEGSIANNSKTLKPILYALLGMGIVVAGIQSDLGSAGVLVMMAGTMAYVAGLPLKRIGLISAVVVVGVVLAVVSSPYRMSRVETYLHPSANCSSNGYQVCQALIAVGSGGITGKGLGGSVQANGYLPEADNDSIFAVYAEMFGFIGCVALLGVYVAFFSRIKFIAEHTNDEFTRLLMVGILCWLSVQTLVNIGAMIGIFPLKGITLPFISYGGTSIVFTTAAIGLVFQASQYTTKSLPEVAVVNDPDKPSADIRNTSMRRRASY